MRMRAVEPKRLHKLTIVTLNIVLHRLGSILREILSYIGNELRKTLEKLREEADKATACVSMLKTYKCGYCVVHLLTMDRVLHESIPKGVLIL